MPKTKEEREEYQKKYREKNKESIQKKKKEKDKIYYQENKERIAIRHKKRYQDNKKMRTEYQIKYREENPEKTHETETKYNWKRKGLHCEDIDSLYCHYTNAKNCDECDIEFGEKGDGTGTFKCMDHSHITGKFRNFLCNSCNRRRGEYNL